MHGHKNRGAYTSNTFFMADYYQRPFLLLHQENARIYQNFTMPHSIRNRFWQLVPPGEYPSEKGRVFLSSYLTVIESELAKQIKELSVAYCIHLYRRLAPGPIGRDQQPRTIGLTRAVLEAAIQKYAPLQLCSKIAESSAIPIGKVLGGLLMAPEFEVERNIVAQANQLVLTDFTSTDLLAFYDLERLAYEIWRTAATLRTTGKGAPLIVCDPPECFADGRSTELDFLVTNYDKRTGRSEWSSSASGVTFADVAQQSVEGCVLVPIYNVGGVTSTDFKDFFSQMYGARLMSEVIFNFVWVPFNLREYRKAHLPFATAFYDRYNVSLDAVLALIAALLLRVEYSWLQTRGMSFFRFFQRAYEGPDNLKDIRDAILLLLTDACKMLGIDETTVASDEIQTALDFWTLNNSNRKAIDLSYSGPHYLLLPVQENRVLIDYAWILRRLHDLFLGISIPDQNFKGDALETLIRSAQSVLPTKPCKTDKGESRQIDYAVACGSHLVIAECKAVGMSIAFDRGDPKAIKYRTNNVVERGLYEVDDKAKWLAVYPLGTNYDLSNYDYILPVVVSPFVEFIPSQDTRYWISRDLPRVITPKEFENLLNDPAAIVNAFNRIPIR
jgi:hypothetical protein